MLRLLLSLQILVVTVHNSYFYLNTHILGTRFSSYIFNSHGKQWELRWIRVDQSH